MSELGKRGLTVALICTEPFVKLGKTQARVLGLPDLPLVLIPHPLGGLSLDKVQERANVAVPQIADLIRESAK